MSYCPNCGVKVAEGMSFCPSCGAKVAAPVISQPVVSHLKCPKCGSENVQKYSLWKKSHNKEVAGLGCLTWGIGCLIVVLLFIFAPLLLFVAGVGLVVLLPVIIVIVIAAVVFYIIQQSYESNRYICLRCERNFKA